MSNLYYDIQIIDSWSIIAKLPQNVERNYYDSSAGCICDPPGMAAAATFLASERKVFTGLILN
jgi:hypothetical protein